MDLADLFVPVACDAQEADFPLDILPGKSTRGDVYLVKQWTLLSSVVCSNERVVPSEDIPVIWVRCIATREEALQSAPKCLLAAACGRNVMVYDEDSPGVLTGRLLALLATAQRRMHSELELGGRITDVFYDTQAAFEESFLKTATSLRMTLHGVDMAPHQDYFLQSLGGTFPSGTSQIILAVARGVDAFVMPFHGDKYGCAVLDNKHVLLGAY
jgi:hypothetical protein